MSAAPTDDSKKDGMNQEPISAEKRIGRSLTAMWLKGVRLVAIDFAIRDARSIRDLETRSTQSRYALNNAKERAYAKHAA